jgi:peptidase E
LANARRPTTLIAGQFGSPHFGTKPYLGEALARTGKRQPVVLYVGVANGDDLRFGAALAQVAKDAGAHEVVWPKLVRKRKQLATMRAALAAADLVFVGGGDVDAGMRALHDAALVEDLHAAAARGAVFVGMSAGAIMLGERWIRWPHVHAGDHEAETYECLAIVPYAVDTHGEGDDWQEARSYAAVRARELGEEARAYCVPSGGALVIHPQGKLEARGEPVPVFAAAPERAARLTTTLEAGE